LHLKTGKDKFVKKHKRDLKGVQKKYLEARESKGRAVEETEKVREILMQEYRNGKMVEFSIDIMKVNIEMRTQVLSEIYKEGKLDLVQRYLTSVTPRLKNEILVTEYKKANLDFVYGNFGKIDNGDLKETILSKELKEKNYKFLYDNYDYIYNKDVRDKIMKYAFKEGNVDFMNKHLEDMPKSMKLEAAIKYKDLKLSKVELAQLLKR